MDAGCQILHVHDLPQLYTKPSFVDLESALDLLKLTPSAFAGNQNGTDTVVSPRVDPDGVPRYLTSIVSSSLSWLESDDAREQIWDNASARLSERAGRNAMPNMTRSFQINDELTISLYEPSLTEDNLGLKTWTSSLLLSKRLSNLRHHVPRHCTRVLELGAGTGLVGLAASCIWDVDVVLTDLPEIVPNLKKNVESNSDLSTDKSYAGLEVWPLDWSDPLAKPSTEEDTFTVILAADPIYTADHPRMLVETVRRWITYSNDARFIVELPLRKGYDAERNDLRARLVEAGMDMVEDGTEVGFDDWQGQDGRPAEVECWWSVWKLNMSK